VFPPLRLIRFILPLLVLLSMITVAIAQDLARYCNSRFGFCVEYPKYLGIEPAPTNNDGRRFYDPDGFLLIASGINNALDETLQTEMLSQKGEFDKVTYQKVGKNWYVLSGVKGSEILYLKTYVGGGSINHLYIRYPVQMKSTYDKIVDVVSRSFVPGSLSSAH
jgi:hypothetical protein